MKQVCKSTALVLSILRPSNKLMLARAQLVRSTGQDVLGTEKPATGEMLSAKVSVVARCLAPQKGGCPRKPVADDRQEALTFPKVTRQCARSCSSKAKN